MLFNPLLLLIYVPVCAFVGFAGRNRSIGFTGVFTFALLLSPIVVSLILLVSAPRTVEKST